MLPEESVQFNMLVQELRKLMQIENTWKFTGENLA